MLASVAGLFLFNRRFIFPHSNLHKVDLFLPLSILDQCFRHYLRCVPLVFLGWVSFFQKTFFRINCSQTGNMILFWPKPQKHMSRRGTVTTPLLLVFLTKDFRLSCIKASQFPHELLKNTGTITILIIRPMQFFLDENAVARMRHFTPFKCCFHVLSWPPSPVRSSRRLKCYFRFFEVGCNIFGGIWGFFIIKELNVLRRYYGYLKRKF